MPEFDDANAPANFKAHLDYSIPIIERYTVLLRDGETTATIYPIHSAEELPPGLLAFLCDEFNMEVERGDTFPFFDTLHIEAFQNYWFGSFAAVMVLGDVATLDRSRQWEKECLGTFYVKPNYPGRCSHICTAGFLVNAGIRGKGIGRTLAECYLEWAPRLGYTYSIFNLVFDSNEAAKKILDSLGFKTIGKIKAAGILKGYSQPVDACIYGRELMVNMDPSGGSFRFDRIRYYLETGNYPKNLDRQEKSRLRSSASHYRLIEGKLMLKGREVISDPAKQLEIATMYHQLGHPGVNKSTAAIAEKYHWSRIKDTVAMVLRDCDECRAQRGLVVKRGPQSHYRVQRADSVVGRSQKKNLTPALPSSGEPAHMQHHFHHHDHQATNQGLNTHQSDHQNILSSHFDADDPSGIIAAVEAAQRTHSTTSARPGARAPEGRPHSTQAHTKPQQQHETKVGQKPKAASNANTDKSGRSVQQKHQFEYQDEPDHDQHGYTYPNHDGIDPEVLSRALIQANEDSAEEYK